MNKLLRDKKAILLFIAPTLMIFTLVVITSIFMSGYYSLFDWDGIGEKIFIGFGNYKRLFVDNNDGFLKAAGNSLLLAVCSVFGQLIPAVFFALVLARGARGEGFFRTVFFIPVVLSSVVLGQLWSMIYHPSYGLLNTLLKTMGLESLTRQWLGETETALAAVFVVIIWQYIGYHMLLIYAGIKRIPMDIYEAAEIDGANPFQTAAKITIPLVMPTIKTSMVLAVIGSLKLFDLVYVLTNGGPMHATEVPSTLMYRTIFQKNLYGYGSSMAIFIIVECLLFTLLINLYKPKQYTY